MLSILAGLGLGLSLIVAIGAQNVYVLRQGIRREHVLTVVLICALSDAALIVIGVAGLGALIEAAPWLVTAARWFGALFLLGYAVLAARRAWRGGDSAVVEVVPQPELRRSRLAKHTGVALTTLALTWLNPHVYLDTVLLLGSVAATHGDERWLFAAGAVCASILWFSALGFGARSLGRLLGTPRAWRVLDGAIAVVMVVLAIGLILPILAG